MPKSPLLKRKASIADLEDITKIQCSNGNWNYDPYMQGLANGMILSLHTVKDLPGEPVFKHAPETWLADIHVDPNDPAHQPIPMTAATPKILYWGGRPGAKELIPQNSNYRAGIWLTDSIKVAASFGREIYRVEVTGLNNPFIVDAQGEFYAEIPTPPEMVSEGFTFLDTCDSDLIVQFALQRGHDSVVIKNVVEGFSGGGVGLSHQSGTDYVLLKEGQGKIVSSFDYKSTLDVWGMPKDPKFSAASKKAETAYTDEDLEEWLADLHVDPVEGGTVPMTAAAEKEAMGAIKLPMENINLFVETLRKNILAHLKKATKNNPLDTLLGAIKVIPGPYKGAFHGFTPCIVQSEGFSASPVETDSTLYIRGEVSLVTSSSAGTGHVVCSGEMTTTKRTSSPKVVRDLSDSRGYRHEAPDFAYAKEGKMRLGLAPDVTLGDAIQMLSKSKEEIAHLRAVIVHEITHAFQHHAMGDKQKALPSYYKPEGAPVVDPNTGKKQQYYTRDTVLYRNFPKEQEALLGQLVDRCRGYYKRKNKKPVSEQDVKNLLAQDDFWNAWSPDLTETNRREIYKEVYKALVDDKASKSGSTHTAAAIDATNWEDYLVPTEEGISEEDLKQVVAASGLAYTAFQTNPLVVTLGDQYLLVKDGQEFFVEEDWGQVLEDIEYDIPFLLLNWIHGRFRLDSEFLLDRKILKLEGYYFRLDHTKKEGDLIQDIEQWVRDLDDSDIWDLVGDPDELYNDVIGSSLKDFHEHPSDVYHYTTEENLEEIIASGELETTSGTGLTNRFAAGVFTSVDPEEYADGTYGNVCLEIDLPAFLRDFPGVKLSFEPEIEDCLAKEQVVGSLNLDGSINVEPDHSGGMSYGTIIVGAAIPLKYITVDGHPLEPKKASKKDETYSLPLSEAVEEHERLVEVLKSPSHADDLKEVQEQESELREMKEKQASLDIPAEVAEAIFFDEDDSAIPEGCFVHGRARSDRLKTEWPVQCTRKADVACNYAGSTGTVWLLKPKESAKVADFSSEYTDDMEGFLDALQAVYEDEAENESTPVGLVVSWIAASLGVDASEVSWEDFEEEIRSQFTPYNIVDSAQAFDNNEWINLLEYFPGGFPDFVLVPEDGAVVIPGALDAIDTVNLTALANGDTPKEAKQAHESQWDTPAFKSWFGNSKVVDRKGNPLMVFHGTKEDFDTFDPTKGRGDGYWGKGFYFTDDPSLASGHGREGNVKPVYLRILNPATPEVVNTLEPENLEANGYDGIITGDGVYVVFKPNQIKSAIGNSGAFNPEDNRITASVAYKPFAEASVEEKIERLASNPYHPDRYYHVTSPDAIQSILTTGLKGDEIWVSKGQPWKEYIEGACLELNLEGMELHPDTRWVEEAGTFVAIEPIPASRITRVFDWIPEWDMREDRAAKFLSRRGKDEVKEQVMSKFAKVEWDLSPVEDHERAIKLSYKGKLGPNFEVFIYPRQDKGFDCDVHVVTGYGKRNPGVGGNKPYAPCVDFNGTELATAQALATEIKKCMDQELNSLADAARSKGDKALAYNLTREAANLYQEVLNDVTKMLVKLPNPLTNWGKAPN